MYKVTARVTITNKKEKQKKEPVTTTALLSKPDFKRKSVVKYSSMQMYDKINIAAMCIFATNNSSLMDLLIAA